MKKLFIFGLSTALLAGSVTSCAKTTKRKMDNDWKLASFSETTTTVQSNGDKTIEEVVTTDGSSITVNNTDPSGVVTKYTGTIKEMSYTISKKDGTYERISDITVSNADGTITSHIEETEKGTWNFLGNVEDFEKNERVIFNTISLDKTETIDYTLFGLSSTDKTVDNKTYANGEKSSIMTIVESKKDELTMSSTENSTWVNNDNGTTTSGSTTVDGTFSLVAK